MTGNELLRRLRRLAKQKRLALLYEARPGKGRIYVGDRFTTIPALTHEIAPGLLTKILRDLGLTRRDLS
jgi:mRNA interferase HicA